MSVLSGYLVSQYFLKINKPPFIFKHQWTHGITHFCFYFSEHPPQLWFQNIFNFHEPYTQLLCSSCQQRTLSFITSKMLLLRVIILNFLANIYTHFHMQPKFRNNSSLVSEKEMFLLLIKGSLSNCAFCPIIVSLIFSISMSILLYWFPAQLLCILYICYMLYPFHSFSISCIFSHDCNQLLILPLSMF